MKALRIEAAVAGVFATGTALFAVFGPGPMPFRMVCLLAAPFLACTSVVFWRLR